MRGVPASETSAMAAPSPSRRNRAGRAFAALWSWYGVSGVAVEQFARDAGVFTGDQVGAGEGLQRAQGDIAEIADRRGNQIEPRRKPRTLDRLVGNDEAADGAFLIARSIARMLARIVAGCVANRDAHCRHFRLAFAKRHSRAKFIIFFI